MVGYDIHTCLCRRRKGFGRCSVPSCPLRAYLSASLPPFLRMFSLLLSCPPLTTEDCCPFVHKCDPHSHTPLRFPSSFSLPFLLNSIARAVILRPPISNFLPPPTPPRPPPFLSKLLTSASLLAPIPLESRCQPSPPPAASFPPTSCHHRRCPAKA